jgi:L-seryl-tRNA(Ser) seleniumtransferase
MVVRWPRHGDDVDGAPAAGTGVENVARCLRRLSILIIGRIEKDAVVLDLRCLDDTDAFLDQMPALGAALAAGPHIGDKS